jgi:phospholipase/lecithinase/hemolysin
MVFDAHARLGAILDEPGKYGIVNTTNFCAGYDQPDIAVNYKEYGCPTPLKDYFWFNSGHMTSHVHKVLAGELEKWLDLR